MRHFNRFEAVIDFAFWKEICETHGEKRHFNRGEYFARSGETLRHVGWILSGGFRHSITDSSGNYKAVGFVFKESILANYLSFMLEQPMPTDLVAIAESEVLVAPASLIRDRLMADPTLHIAVTQILFKQAYDRILDSYMYCAEERYRILMERYPRILEYLSLGEVASYLNISLRQIHRFREARNKSSGR